MTGVERARPNDLRPLLAMMAEFHAVEHIQAPNLQASVSRLLTNRALGEIVVARSGPKIVGYAVVGFGFSLEFGGRDAFLDELYVAPGERGKGLGSELMLACETVAKEGGSSTLHLEVDHANARAHELYRRSGYNDHARHLMTKRFG